jgi:hypothetical protein
MTRFKGFFELQSPQDLLRKLGHDSDRVKKSPMDSYAAFDLFVTAYHMLDWLHPGDSNKATRKQMESDNNILQVVSHLANGSKHFQVTRHHAVKETIIHEGAFDPNVFGSNAFDVGELRVELDGDAAREFGASTGVLELAAKALRFWEEHV